MLTFFDIECYPNYFLAMLRREDGKTATFVRADGLVKPDELDKLKRLVSSGTIVSFNGNNYDLPMISAALAGFDNAGLKRVSDKIVLNNLKPWIVAREMGFELIEGLDHIDLIEVAPLRASLKAYGARLHTKRLQDLPYDPNLPLTREQMIEVATYCGNDLELTAQLFASLEKQIDLRRAMSKTYGIDLRSKSDAQIAEAVLQKGVGELLKRKVRAPEIPEGTSYYYTAPDWVRFRTKPLQDLLGDIKLAKFIVSASGSVDLPAALKGKKIEIGKGVYRLGIGGLHSSEERSSWYSDGKRVLIDRDVASYYPRIILNNGWHPAHMGKAFLTVYNDIVEKRLAAKHAGDKVTADALKITINGSFGKLGNKYSALYSPNLLIQTTITGQLALLMLIEALEDQGIPVVSANTDGVVMYPLRCDVDLCNAIVADWERNTGFETEATEYRSLHSRDVNNYVAVKPDGEYKCKGVFAPGSLMKNPVNEIVTEAVVQYLVNRTPPEVTIAECRDIRKFLTVRSVKGGGVYGDQYLGKTVRWYYSTKAKGRTINYKVNGYTVARSDGAMPAMVLPDELPSDVDFEWYANEAEEVLKGVGV